MTQLQLEALNRKERITRRIRSGERYKNIAADEDVSQAYVSLVAVKAGIWRKPRAVSAPTETLDQPKRG